MAKFFNKIIWNKQPDHEYDISTTADKVFIQESKHFTVLDFFSWVKSFFEKGAFFFYGTDEPQSYQTRVWLDTTPFFILYIYYIIFFIKNQYYFFISASKPITSQVSRSRRTV